MKILYSSAFGLKEFEPVLMQKINLIYIHVEMIFLSYVDDVSSYI